jgi:DtxR family Mn-dependent transcriptional regulator
VSVSDEGLTSAIEDYSRAIYALQERHDGEPVATSSLADRLGLAPGSVSGMLKRMSDLELVDREPYRGVRLTNRGERTALRVIRRHRLLELFLHQTLGFPWESLDDEADRLEHSVSQELEAAIYERLDRPTTDPHGDPIPDQDLRIVKNRTTRLDEATEGRRVRFVRVSDSDPEMLRYLRERGLELGSMLDVIGHEPFGGPLTIRLVGSRVTHSLAPALARSMRVEPAHGSHADG